MKMRDAGVLGAALMAGTGVGMFGSLGEAAKAFVSLDCVFELLQRETKRHDVGLEMYNLLYRQLAMLRS
jgi:xylulokinase